SELTYEETYQDFLSEPKVRVPEPSSIAALAFIGGGMFLSRRAWSRPDDRNGATHRRRPGGRCRLTVVAAAPPAPRRAVRRGRHPARSREPPARSARPTIMNGPTSMLVCVIASVAILNTAYGPGGDPTDDGGTAATSVTTAGARDRSRPAPDPDGPPLDADVPWYGDAILDEDDRTLHLSVGSSPEGDGPCEQRFDHEVTETAESVTIAFDLLERPSNDSAASGPIACKAMAEPQTFEFTLSEPLGDRLLFDGLSDTPQIVHRKAELLDLTYLPVELEGAEVYGLPCNDGYPCGIGSGDHAGWQQTVRPGADADWYVSVRQRTEGTFTAPGAKLGEVEVRGVVADLYEGRNGTLHLLHWTEDGLDVAVRGEVRSRRTSFSYDDELVAIAEGLRFPGDG
ncbi:MAG: PEP-CTERM sorting domain-containing protein, partial [Actinomycetota bacterium]|nr:PEP-CTERM sorting domain-containing protein [Actinomycetota bacterium]